MNEVLMKSIIEFGAFAAIGLVALGAVFGCTIAANAAVGAWKKCYLQEKLAPFQLVIFVGMPLTQVIYGMILMFVISGKVEDAACLKLSTVFLFVGILAGIIMMVCAWWQGKAAAHCCDALAETGKGFTNYLIVLGVIETISIFVMAFGMLLLNSIK